MMSRARFCFPLAADVKRLCPIIRLSLLTTAATSSAMVPRETTRTLWSSVARGVSPARFVIAPSAHGNISRRISRIRFAIAAMLISTGVQLVGADNGLPDAAEKSDRLMVRTLLDQHADPNSAQADGMTALHWAAHLDDSETARLLVKAGANVNAT